MTDRSSVHPPASGRPAPQGPSRGNGAGVLGHTADLAGPPWAGGTHIPSFALYGEAASLGQELLHIEEVQSRSRLYHWEIQPHTHQGLYQVLWLWRGQAEVLLDEHRSAAQAPAAIVLPPSVVHGFRFAPETDGRVLTLSARWLLEGETGALGAAFQELFAAPRLLHFWAEEAAAQRLDALFRELTHEFQWPTGAGGSPCWAGWRGRWCGAWHRPARNSAKPPRRARGHTSTRRSLRDFCCWWSSIFWSTGRCSATRSGWGCRCSA